MEAPPVVLPDGNTLFADRSLRFTQWARAHAMGGFLSFMAKLAQMQHEVLHARTLRLEREGRGRPPLAVDALIHRSNWAADFTDLVEALQRDADGALVPVLARAASLDAATRGLYAEAFLAARFEDVEDRAVLPFIGAALQIHWTRLAGALSAADFAGVESGTHCPVCGFHPVASVLHTAGERSGRRYLHCALCGSEWHMIRIKCSLCESLAHIQYFNLTGDTQPHHAAVRAEACDDCHGYLKILDRAKDAAADAYADDLATLALDVLLDEAGYRRGGANLLFVPGTGEV
jgi:FdhE protein